MRYKNFIAAFALLGLLSSCNDDDEITERNVKPIVTADHTAFTVTEGDVITVTLTTNTPYKTNMEFKLELVGGTGSFRDFTCDGTETTEGDGLGLIGYKIVFPAYATSHTFTITPEFDVYAEGAETFQFKLTSDGNGRGLVADNSQDISVLVNDKTSADFWINLDFQGNTTDRHGNIHAGEFKDNAATPATHAFCDVDLDLEVYDTNGNIIADSYTSCPENIILPASTPDGTYFIVPSFWSTNGITVANSTIIPTVLTSGKPGYFSDKLDMTGLFDVKVGGYQQTNDPDAYQLVRELVKSGSTWTLKDANTGDVLGTGKYASVLNAIKAKKNKKK